MLNQTISQIAVDCKKIKNFFTDIIGAVYFFFENYRKRYPYILEGEKSNPNNSNETILLYRISGKRHTYEITAKEMCNTKDLICKFHPLDIRTICFIAGAEQILAIPPEQRVNKFGKFKKKILRQ